MVVKVHICLKAPHMNMNIWIGNYKKDNTEKEHRISNDSKTYLKYNNDIQDNKCQN